MGAIEFRFHFSEEMVSIVNTFNGFKEKIKEIPQQKYS